MKDYKSHIKHGDNHVGYGGYCERLKDKSSESSAI